MGSIVVVGSYGAGLTVQLACAPRAGETVTGTAFEVAHGGKGSNQAVAAARLGARTTLCTVVGDDHYGTDAYALWRDEGVDTSLVRTLPGSTMVGVILVEETGENRIAIVPGVLDQLEPSALEPLRAHLPAADVLVVGLEIPVATAQEALRLGRDAGVTTVLNPAPAPAEPLAVDMLATVDHLTPNRTEAATLAGLPADTDPLELVGHPVFADVATVLVTLGAEGVLVRHRDDITHVPAEPVTPVDTTGAGDSFTAAYAVKVAQGADPVTAARFAVRAAALSVTRRHVIPSLPYAQDVTDAHT